MAEGGVMRYLVWTLAAILAIIGLGLSFEKSRLEDEVLRHPATALGAHAERIGLHHGWAQATHMQHLEHLLLDVGTYAFIVGAGIMVISTFPTRPRR
jgi:hypothetical protein